jgi:Holliday junction resolvase
LRLLQTGGFAAVRVPLSDAAGGRLGDDLAVPMLGRHLCVEVKAEPRGQR